MNQIEKKKNISLKEIEKENIDPSTGLLPQKENKNKKIKKPLTIRKENNSIKVKCLRY